MILSTVYLARLVKIKSPWFAWTKTFFLGIVFVLSVSYLKWMLVLNPWIEIGVSLLLSGIIYAALLIILNIVDLDDLKMVYSRIVG